MVRGHAASRPGRTPPAHSTAAVVALFTALTLLTTYPLWLHPASTMLPGGPDGELFVWTLSWDAHAFLHQPFAIFDANIYHPLRDTLAFSENLIGTAIFSAPIQWLTGNPVFALNVVSLLSTLLCGVGTWLLARRLGLEQGAALFFTLQVLSSGHGAAFMALACGGLLVYRASLGEPLRAWRRVRDLGVAGLLLFAAQPGSFAIAEVPLPDPVNPGEFERRQTAYMMHASAH